MKHTTGIKGVHVKEVAGIFTRTVEEVRGQLGVEQEPPLVPRERRPGVPAVPRERLQVPGRVGHDFAEWTSWLPS